jgi:EmrB/QacA subfamily drug resistance transporter
MTTTGTTNKWLVLAVVCTALFIIMMQSTTINLANPNIMRDFGATMTQVQWVLTGYMLAFTSFLLTMGRLGDAIGRKKIFMIGLAFYSLGGVLAGISPGIAWLIGASVIQGFGASMMMPATTSLIAANFEKKERGAAMGMWGAISGLAVVAGPLVGGSLTTSGLGPGLNALLGIDQGWRYIYFVSTLLGLIAIVGTLLLVPESKDESEGFRLDPLAVLLSAGSLFLITFGLVEGGKNYGWFLKKADFSLFGLPIGFGPLSVTPVILGLALVLGVVFLLRESRKAKPLFEAKLFADPNFAGGTTVTAILNFAMMGTFFLTPFFLKSVLGLDALQSGFTMIPMALAVVVASPLAGTLADRFGAKWIIFVGMLVMSLALFLIARLSPETTLASLVFPFIVLGVGIGLPMSPTTSAALLDVPVAKVGGASGTLSMLRQVGGILGIVLIATAFGNAVPSNLEKGIAAEAAPSERLAKKFDRVKAMMLDGMKDSGSSGSTTMDVASYKDRLAPFFPDQADQDAVGASLTHGVMVGLSNAMNDSFRLAAFAPLLGALAALFMKSPGRREKVVAKAKGDEVPAIAAGEEA